VSFLNRVWYFRTYRVRSIASLTLTRILSPAFGRLKSRSESMMPLQRWTSLGARRDGRERIVDLVHHAGRQRADGRELLGLRKAILGGAPFGDVFTDGDHVRDRTVVEAHGDFRDAVGAQVARAHRFHLEDLQAARREHFIEFPSQHTGGLTMEDLEDRAADRLLPRDTLHAGLALVIPHRDAVVAIDHVEPHGERIDDALRNAALAVDLSRALDDFALESLRIGGLAKDRREDVRDRCEERPLIRTERAGRHEYECAERVTGGVEPDDDEAGAISQRGAAELRAQQQRARRGRTHPRFAAQVAFPAEPQRHAGRPDRVADAFQDPREDVGGRLARGEGRGDLRDGVQEGAVILGGRGRLG
jgi:hypothetical protein